MASANVNLVKSIYVDWERGDFSSASWAHSEIEYVITDGPAPGWTGLDGMADAWRDFLRSWEEYRVTADEFRELDDERLLVLDHHRIGRGKTSGVDLTEMGPKGANLFHIHGGKVTRLVFTSTANAPSPISAFPRKRIPRARSLRAQLLR